MQTFKEFISNSSIHCIHYWVDSNLHWIERYVKYTFRFAYYNVISCSIWWMAAFILSTFFCVTLVYMTWCKWEESPVIISFDHKPLSISEIPLPATTICPMTKIKADNFNYTRGYRLMTKLDESSEQALNETEYAQAFTKKPIG